MATFTKPLVSAAALASAAAVAVASPAFTPSTSALSPTAMISAKVDLTSFQTLLSLTATDYINTAFSGYGFAVGPNQPDNPDWAAAFIGTNCNFDCRVNGISGEAYMMLDALINGNDPYTPVKDLKRSALNYFFEGGFSPGMQYLVTEPFGNPDSKLYNPTIAGAIALAFQGAYAFTTLYIQALNTISQFARPIPVVGPYIFGAINSYLGPNSQDYKYGDWSIYAGLSGVLRYALDVIATGFNPYPNPPVSSAAVSTLAAAAVSATALPAASRRVGLTAVADKAAASEAPSTDTTSNDTTSTDTKTPETVKDSTDTGSTTEVKAPETGTKSGNSSDSGSTGSGSTGSTTEVEAPETTPDTKTPSTPSTDPAPSSTGTTQAPTKPAPKRPLRDAFEKATQKINAAAAERRSARSAATAAK